MTAEYRLYTTAELAAMPATARFEDRSGDVWEPHFWIDGKGDTWRGLGYHIITDDGIFPYHGAYKSNSQLARLLLRRLQ